jgi:hypothetical protein
VVSASTTEVMRAADALIVTVTATVEVRHYQVQGLGVRV